MTTLKTTCGRLSLPSSSSFSSPVLFCIHRSLPLSVFASSPALLFPSFCSSSSTYPLSQPVKRFPPRSLIAAAAASAAASLSRVTCSRSSLSLSLEAMKSTRTALRHAQPRALVLQAQQPRSLSLNSTTSRPKVGEEAMSATLWRDGGRRGLFGLGEVLGVLANVRTVPPAWCWRDRGARWYRGGAVLRLSI